MGQRNNDPGQVAPREGRYANSFQVGHNAFEFFLDFGQVSPESAEVRFHSRIIAGPVFAKVLAKLLQESLDRYEQTFGPIPQDNV
jgi:hypothetical protein